jgi:hypothetical protein
VNRLTLERYNWRVKPRRPWWLVRDPELRRPIDLVVPVVDGVAVADRVGLGFPGLPSRYVVSPSRHWLGHPEYVECDDDDVEKTVILDGGCGVAGCCGLSATVTVGDEVVTWVGFFARITPRIDERISFTFSLADYRDAIASISLVEPTAWVERIPSRVTWVENRRLRRSPVRVRPGDSNS